MTKHFWPLTQCKLKLINKGRPKGGSRVLSLILSTAIAGHNSSTTPGHIANLFVAWSAVWLLFSFFFVLIFYLVFCFTLLIYLTVALTELSPKSLDKLWKENPEGWVSLDSKLNFQYPTAQTRAKLLVYAITVPGDFLRPSLAVFPQRFSINSHSNFL